MFLLFFTFFFLLRLPAINYFSIATVLCRVRIWLQSAAHNSWDGKREGECACYDHCWACLKCDASFVCSYFFHDLKEINNFPCDKLWQVKHSIEIIWDTYLRIYACTCIHIQKYIQNLIAKPVSYCFWTVAVTKYRCLINCILRRIRGWRWGYVFQFIFHHFRNIRSKAAVYVLLQKFPLAIFRLTPLQL